MTYDYPHESRPAARVVLINDDDQVLYLHAREHAEGRGFWVMPGGGLEPEETFEEAAVREVKEETGFSIVLGPCLWRRRHIFDWRGRKHDQFELYYVAHISGMTTVAGKADDYVIGYKWWSLNEIVRSKEEFAPRRIGQLLAPILNGDYPLQPFDCGI